MNETSVSPLRRSARQPFEAPVRPTRPEETTCRPVALTGAERTFDPLRRGHAWVPLKRDDVKR